MAHSRAQAGAQALSPLHMQAGIALWEAIRSGAAEADPSLLHRLILLTYCDLKHHRLSLDPAS